MDDLLAMERELRGKVDAAKRDVAARQAVLSQCVLFVPHFLSQVNGEG